MANAQLNAVGYQKVKLSGLKPKKLLVFLPEHPCHRTRQSL
jgi:hypothetical protein